MLSISSGYSINYLTDEVATGRESYYTGAVAAGEPPGVWYGGGAEALGLSGEVDAETMEAVYLHMLDPRDPNTAERATWGLSSHLGRAAMQCRTPKERFEDLLAKEPGAGPERRAELQAVAERTARQPVAFLDATFSVQKSVTVVAVAFERAENTALANAERAVEQAEQWRAAGQIEQAERAVGQAEQWRAEQAAWAEHRAAVERAAMAGARASLDYLEEHAGYGRVGHHGGGAGRWIDSHQFVTAQFLQHDSRDRDPQLHVHQAILNRQLCADGEWRTLDSRAIHAFRPAAAAHGERVMEAQLARELGLRFETRPDGKAREIVGVPNQVMDLFSSRRRHITEATQTAVAEFRDKFGRDPSALELSRISQQATLATRRGKSHDGETADERLERWERECRTELEGGLGKVAASALAAGREGPAEAARWDPREVIARAVDRVSKTQQTWGRPDLVRAISDELPANLGVARPGKVLERLTDAALEQVIATRGSEPAEGLPEELLLADGRSAYQQPAGERYAAPGQIAAERAIEDAGRWRGGPQVTAEEAARAVARYAEQGHELGADQAAAVRGVLSSGIVVETLAAAAGAGKSHVVGAIHDSWTAGRVIGLAPSQVAAQVLADEGVATTANLTAWQSAHMRGEDWAQLRPGDLVVVDEAGMAPTADIANVVERAGHAGAKVLLVGDPRQLGAVGPGGVLADIGARGGTYELTEVRRFREGWEGQASLRLRGADPTALDQYDRHGRIRDGGTPDEAQEQAARAWLADTLDGKDSLLVVGDNEGANRASGSLRAQLVRLGRVAEAGVPMERDGNLAGVGDRVQARRNAWELLDSNDPTKRCPINRDTYTVTAMGRDGSLTVVDGSGATIGLPAEYVRQDLALGYASTVYGAQGRTVDTAHMVVAPGADAGSVYVGLTRGRESNTAHVVTRPLPVKSPTGEVPGRDEQPGIEPRSGRAVLAEVLENAADERGALAELAAAEEYAHSTVPTVDRLIDGARVATAGRTAGMLDRLVVEGVLSGEDRERLAADTGTSGVVDRMLRAAELAGKDPEGVLREALQDRNLSGSRSPGQVLAARVKGVVGETAAGITSFHDLIPGGVSEQTRTYLGGLAEAADTRRRELGTEAAASPPEWAVAALGAPPEDLLARADWEARAGWAVAWRENQQYDNGEEPVDSGISAVGPLGAAPPAGLAEKRAVWVTASAALGGDESGPEEAGMSDGRLLARVEAFERERAWAPRWVADELAATAQAAAKQRTDATVWGAHAKDEPGELASAAEQARGEAARLEEIRTDLSEVDEARARWFAHTAVTRDKSERARAMLSARGVDPGAEREKVTAEEWLAADDETRRGEDPHRPVRDEDLAEGHDDAASVEEAAPETGRPDIRETATIDRSELVQPRREVPESGDAEAAVVKAREALDELADRHSLDEGEDEAAEQIPWWVGQDDAADDDSWVAAV